MNSLWNLHMNIFLEFSIQRCIVNIQLMNVSMLNRCQSQEQPNCSKLHYWGESIKVVHTLNLCVAFSSSCALKRSKEPFAFLLILYIHLAYGFQHILGGKSILLQVWFFSNAYSSVFIASIHLESLIASL